MTSEEIMYEFYLNSNTKSRNEAIELLAKRDFKTLSNKHVHWYSSKEKVVELKSILISDVAKELVQIKIEPNETEPMLECNFKIDDNTPFGSNVESKIVICSYLYTIVPFEKCESIAKSYTRTAMWKIKYQPNGNDTKRYLDIIEKRLAELNK